MLLQTTRNIACLFCALYLFEGMLLVENGKTWMFWKDDFALINMSLGSASALHGLNMTKLAFRSSFKIVQVIPSPWPVNSSSNHIFSPFHPLPIIINNPRAYSSCFLQRDTKRQKLTWRRQELLHFTLMKFEDLFPDDEAKFVGDGLKDKKNRQKRSSSSHDIRHSWTVGNRQAMAFFRVFEFQMSHSTFQQ